MSQYNILRKWNIFLTFLQTSIYQNLMKAQARKSNTKHSSIWNFLGKYMEISVMRLVLTMHPPWRAWECVAGGCGASTAATIVKSWAAERWIVFIICPHEVVAALPLRLSTFVELATYDMHRKRFSKYFCECMFTLPLKVSKVKSPELMWVSVVHG
jgi:hypothetical protein